MKRVINLDAESPEVQDFFRQLLTEKELIEFAIGGKVIWHAVPVPISEEARKQFVLERGRELVRQVRERNKGVPAKVIKKEVDDAVQEVRRQLPKAL